VKWYWDVRAPDRWRADRGNLKVLSVSVSRDDDDLTAIFQTRGSGDRYPQLVHALMEESGVHKVSLL
jgi:hypothetical protein